MRGSGRFWLVAAVVVAAAGAARGGSLSQADVQHALDFAADRLEATAAALGTDHDLYPIYTETAGSWHFSGTGNWASGFYPALLWKMHQIETDPARKAFWQTQASLRSDPLRGQSKGDMAANNLFVFRPYYEATGDAALLTDELLRGARVLADDRFHEDIGTIGYLRTATRTDNQEYWHAFVDHMINLEQLVWAADHNPDPAEADRWRDVVRTHARTVGSHMGPNRNPGTEGSWQRGYFDHDPASPTYGEFLFNEAKQGWDDSSTWSRGHAWLIYGLSAAYAGTGDAEVLGHTSDAVDYLLAHLPDAWPGGMRRAGDFIPPWDFDYALAVDPDTERDSSAAAIAASGILKLVEALPPGDPDRDRYGDAARDILSQLAGPGYLAEGTAYDSILLHGCYHHPASVSPSTRFDDGLVWGDYFFVDALLVPEPASACLVAAGALLLLRRRCA